MSTERHSPARLESDADSAVLLFDGVCNLCTGVVRFVLPRDCHGRLRFASLQSDVGRERLEEAGLGALAVPGRDPESMVLVEGDRAYLRSTAALRVAMKLCRGWPLLGLFLLVPRPIRDLVYRWVARHRYDWFGRREACYSPEGDVSERFLDAG